MAKKSKTGSPVATPKNMPTSGKIKNNSSLPRYETPPPPPPKSDKK